MTQALPRQSIIHTLSANSKSFALRDSSSAPNTAADPLMLCAATFACSKSPVKRPALQEWTCQTIPTHFQPRDARAVRFVVRASPSIHLKRSAQRCAHLMLSIACQNSFSNSSKSCFVNSSSSMLPCERRAKTNGSVRTHRRFERAKAERTKVKPTSIVLNLDARLPPGCALLVEPSVF